MIVTGDAVMGIADPMACNIAKRAVQVTLPAPAACFWARQRLSFANPTPYSLALAGPFADGSSVYVVPAYQGVELLAVPRQDGGGHVFMPFVGGGVAGPAGAVGAAGPSGSAGPAGAPADETRLDHLEAGHRRLVLHLLELGFDLPPDLLAALTE